MDQELLDSVASELMQAIESKDKKMLVDALTALVLHIQDEDNSHEEKEQDQE